MTPNVVKKKMSDGVMTKSGYAVHRGVKPAAVTNWIARKRLTSPALREDGKVDVALADQQLDAKVDRTLSASAKRRVTTKPKAAPRQPASTVPAPRDPALVAQEAAQARLLEARALSAMVDAERKRRELEAERGRYLIAEDAKAAWGRALSEFLLQVERSLPDLAITLGIDATGRVALRRWWRNRRVVAAETNRLAAAAAPEFVEDTAA